ncbi:hypothetical protein BD31_I0554 [Candidatus Nitrosopumilus salaria BD31]|uniref:Uncharacterized protein n=1 Tax=Candidatus Nitrosopumilus salarius BD31 TaxID=859350 RepID=I3D313_9ARCH|nr:hypothetical protein [Candidatus Nitrosopumilus salaria]EIJ66106.1 hypothetical protein BD31_I0554 [Candidatus Nitrosopumilus salaria BD31]
MNEKGAGRKPKASIMGGNAFLPVELFRISIPLEFTEGSKKIPNARQPIPYFFSQDEKEEFVKLNRKKIDDIRVEKCPIDLPTKCPSCERLGTPSIVNQKEKYRLERNFGSYPQKPDYKKLVYNHNESPKMCNIGRFEMNGNQITIKLKPSIKSDLLHDRKFRIGSYEFKGTIHD